MICVCMHVSVARDQLFVPTVFTVSIRLYCCPYFATVDVLNINKCTSTSNLTAIIFWWQRQRVYR